MCFCVNFFLLICLTVFYQIVDGISISPYIVGGRDAMDGDAPWQVAVRDDKQEVLCGGSIIAERWIVSAATCITNFGM